MTDTPKKFFDPSQNPLNSDKRLFAPAAARNRDVILNIMRQHAPEEGQALEIACGSGEHAIHFGAALPKLDWQPTDIEQAHLDSVNAHAITENLSNIRSAKYLNVLEENWNIGESASYDLIYNANMIHISPWECSLGLMTGAGKYLKTDGILFMYGPYMREGQHTSESNSVFDASLKSRNPSWGIRALEDVIDIAKQNGLILKDIVQMPANNLSVIYQKQ